MVIFVHFFGNYCKKVNNARSGVRKIQAFLRPCLESTGDIKLSLASAGELGNSWKIVFVLYCILNSTLLELDFITFVFLATPTCRYRFTTDYK